MNYSAAYEEFRESFDHYLAQCEETPAKMMFLRYESHQHLPEQNATPQDLEDYLKLLDVCQDYAMTKNVTSNYIFFDAVKYDQWRVAHNLDDDTEARAQWARAQLQEDVAMHTANPLTWFVITGHPNWYKVSPPQL